jgi:hypothetical protein
LIASIIGHKLFEWSQSREVSIQFDSRDVTPTYLRVIKSDENNPPTLRVHKIVENFQIYQSDIDTMKYLAIGRHMVWMLCDTKIVPIKGPVNPGCWNIMIQAQSTVQTEGSEAPGLSSIQNLHQIESEPELVLRAAADQKLGSIVGNIPMAYMDGYLSFGCIFPQARINFPCDRLNVDIPSFRKRIWKVGIPVRF